MPCILIICSNQSYKLTINIELVNSESFLQEIQSCFLLVSGQNIFFNSSIQNLILYVFLLKDILFNTYFLLMNLELTANVNSHLNEAYPNTYFLCKVHHSLKFIPGKLHSTSALPLGATLNSWDHHHQRQQKTIIQNKWHYCNAKRTAGDVGIKPSNFSPFCACAWPQVTTTVCEY